MSKLKKRILALGLSLIMSLTMIPMFSSLALADEAATITVYLTVSNKGEIAKANDGTVMARKPVTVTDLDEDGKYSFDEALVAAHEAYNSAAGYAQKSGYVNTLWGIATTNNLFFINNAGLKVGVTGDFVEDRDTLVASINKDDAYYSDYYSCFDTNVVKAKPGTEIPLELSAISGMAGGDPVAVSEAALGYFTEDGKYTDLQIATDEEGKATISFDAEGTYYLTASGVVKDKVVTDWNLMSFASDGGAPFGKMDWDTSESWIAYTEKDYGEGPYPASEVKYMDFGDWTDLSDEEAEKIFLLSSNQLITDCPIIAPCCAVGIYVDPEPFNYEEKDFSFIKKDGAAFGMWAPQDGSSWALDGDTVIVHIVPKNKTTYAGFIWGGIEGVDVTAKEQPDVDVAVKSDGSIDLVLSKDCCGKAFPIAPIKKNYSKGSWTSADQYYLAVPAEEFFEKEELAVTNNCGSMFLPEAVSVSTNGKGYVLHLTMGSKSLTKVFVGYAHKVEEDKVLPIRIEGEKGYVNIPVASLEEQIVLAFYGRSWTNRGLTIDLEKKTAVYDPVKITLEEIDELTTEEAVAHAKELTSVELVDLLIEAIQVQYRDENTDKYCAVAKACYDALSDANKEKLADPGYFGDDTGDASKDDPRNQDEIGEKEILVVSFGTSFNDSRVATIKAIEDAIAEAYPEYAVRRAFTAQIIINHIQSRDKEVIDNMEQALDRAVKNNVKDLVIQPTHLMHGAEYDEMCEALAEYEDKFDRIFISEPLLNSDEDKTIVAKAVVDAAIADSDYSTLAEADADKTAIVLMGHGTSHEANVTYEEMQAIFEGLEYNNVFVGTVEGEPESTEVETVLAKVQDAGYTKVILRPLMVVAGDHANNDMADTEDEESWASIFGAALGAENVICQIHGLGEIPEVQQVYVDHIMAIPADYSKVAEAIEAAEKLDKDQYTQDSFAAVLKAIAAVKYDKMLSEQDTVDAMAKAIEDAIAALIEVFSDVTDPDAWFYEVVYDIVQVKNANGTSLMSGYADGSKRFGATDPLTRQDFAIILHRLADEPETPEMDNPFSDAQEDGYYYNSVLWAKAENVISGYEDGRFGVGDQITREQVATILYRFAKDYLKLETTEKGDLSKFKDGTEISSWAEEALTWATGAGIITGKSEGTEIAARGNAARAEIAAMILRFLEYRRYKESTEVIAIVHTNDVHGHIEVEPYVKGLADEMKASGDYSLVLTVSGGDVYGGGNAVAGYYNGELIPQLQDQVYDVIVPGNNDFSTGVAGNVLLTSLYENTKTICANVFVNDDTDVAAFAAGYIPKIGAKDFADMYKGVSQNEDGTLDYSALNLGVVEKDTSPWEPTMIVKTANGTKLGLFGLTCTGGQVGVSTHTDGTVKAAQDCVASLKEDGANVIVGIGHVGWMGEGSEEPANGTDSNSWVIANEVQDMDAFVDAHTHSIIGDGKGCYVGDNKVLINQAACYGDSIGVMYITVKGGKVIDKKAEILRGEDLAAITPDADIQEMVDADLARLSAIAGDPVVITPYFLCCERNYTWDPALDPGGSIRGNETNLGDFVTDLMMLTLSEKLDEEFDFAYLPGFWIRASVIEGVGITKIELASVIGYDNTTLIRKTYTAEQIVELVTAGLASVAPQKEGISFNQYSGLYITYSNDNGVGTPVTIKVGDTLIYDKNDGGIKVEDTWTAKGIALAMGGAVDESDIICKDGPELRELFYNYLATHELGKDYTIYPNVVAPDNRIVEVK